MAPPRTQPCFAQAGERVDVEGYVLRLLSRLGGGANSALWRAEQDDGSEAVFKEVLCHSRAEVAASMFEGRLLRDMQPAQDGRSGWAKPRIPTIWGMHVAQAPESDGDMWQVRFAMSRVSGKPLEDFLVCRKLAKAPKASSDPLGEVSEACRYTWELFAQVVPLLEQVSHHAKHGEVTARNVLVEDVHGWQPRFGLAGFGRAAQQWTLRVDEPRPEFLGDGRYLPAQVLQALDGAHSMSSGIQLCTDEADACFDIFALGITALRCFVGMMPRISAAVVTRQVPADVKVLLENMRELELAWEVYWLNAARVWRCFRLGACSEMASPSSVSTVEEKFEAVKQALSEVREVLVAKPTIERFKLAPILLEVLTVALGDSPSWLEVRRVMQRGACTFDAVLVSAGQSQASTESPAASARSASSPAPSLPPSPPFSMPATPRTPATPTSRTFSFESCVLRTLDVEARDNVSDPDSDSGEYVSV